MQMETENHLFVVWRDRPPINAHNVYRVDGNIMFEDGKAKFKLKNGHKVVIDADQLFEIGISGTDERIKRS